MSPDTCAALHAALIKTRRLRVNESLHVVQARTLDVDDYVALAFLPTLAGRTPTRIDNHCIRCVWDEVLWG